MLMRPPRVPHNRKRKAPDALEEHKPSRRMMAVVSYDGTDWSGWQTQSHGRTIQDSLEARLSGLLRVQTTIAGAGRTDAGVHAKAQVFHFDLPTTSLSSLGLRPEHTSEDAAAAVQLRMTGLSENCGLPSSIQVLSVIPAPGGDAFHARDSCIGKRYVYTVREGLGTPFNARYSWALGRSKMCDLEAMRLAAAHLIGTHNFASFGVLRDGDPRDPVKNLRRLEIQRISSDPSEGGDRVIITAEADRFLYHMMRMISGTLVRVGLGKMKASDVKTLLLAKGRTGGPVSAHKAPAQGLCMEEAFYDAA